MTFRVFRRHELWWIDDPTLQIGGVFIDLVSAIRFIRHYESRARIVVRTRPSDA
jgi:hypothetical protein